MNLLRFAVLYATCGIGWVFYNIAYVALRAPSIGAKVADQLRNRWVWAGLLIGSLFWPVCVLFTLFPFAFGPSIRDHIFRRFRRDYVDGPKWDAALADPPPRLLTHRPALGCDGDHDWFGPDCACLKLCPTCGMKVPTPEYRELMAQEPGPSVSGPDYSSR